MTKVVTTGQMRAIEAAANRAGLTYAQMMEAAGRAVAQAVLDRSDTATEKVVVLCGAGNNGGDGLVAAYYLAEAGAAVSVYCPAPPDEQSPNLQRVRARGLPIENLAGDANGQILEQWLSQATVVVDAIFGTGVRLPLSGRPADLLKQAAQALAARAVPPRVVAVDCPSGLNCDTGEVDPAALFADVGLADVRHHRERVGHAGDDRLAHQLLRKRQLHPDSDHAVASIVFVRSVGTSVVVSVRSVTVAPSASLRLPERSPSRSRVTYR